MSDLTNGQRNARRASWAIGQLIFKPNSAGHLSRMFIRMGVRDPHEAMNRTYRLQAHESLYFYFMLAIGMVALFFAASSAALFKQNDDWGQLFLVVAGLAVLWGLKVAHGAILHNAVKDLPKARQFYTYRWYWPLTLNTSTRLTRLPRALLNGDRTITEKGIDVGGIIIWFTFVQLPLYYFVGMTVYEVATGL